jgi:hypothetical protein
VHGAPAPGKLLQYCDECSLATHQALKDVLVFYRALTSRGNSGVIPSVVPVGEKLMLLATILLIGFVVVLLTLTALL